MSPLLIIVWLKHILLRNYLHNIYNVYSEHTFEIGYGQQQNFINFSSYLSVSTKPKFHIVIDKKKSHEYAVLKVTEFETVTQISR